MAERENLMSHPKKITVRAFKSSCVKYERKD